MQQNVDSFQALYSYLKNTESAEAYELLQRIREGHSLDYALKFVKSRAAIDPSNSMLSSASASATQLDPSLLLSRQIDDGNFNDTLLSAAWSNLTIDAVRDGAECFFRYLGTMFPIFSREEVEEIIHTFKESAHPIRDVTTEEIRYKAIACGELLAVCAVGFQYDRQNLPNGNGTQNFVSIILTPTTNLAHISFLGIVVFVLSLLRTSTH